MIENDESGEHRALLESSLPRKISIPVVHNKQRHQWDCGIACLLMVLDHNKRADFLERYDKLLADEGIRKSVWTIDLAYLLRRLGVEYKYYTTTLGVDPTYGSNTYYRGVITLDQARVVTKFKGAVENEVLVVQRTLTLDDVLSHLSKYKTAIVLVDSSKMGCQSHLKHKLVEKWLFQFCCGCCLKCTKKRSFVGHYLVLCGYDLHGRTVHYRNPVYSSGICKMSFTMFESARKAHGTDQDIILVETR